MDNGTRAELDLSQTNRSDRHKPQALGIKSDHSTVANVDKFDPGFSDGGGLDLNKYSSDDLDMFGDDNKYIDSTKNASRVVDDNKGRERTGELELFNRNGRNLDKFDTNGCRRKSLSPRDGYEDLMDGILNDISDDEM